MFAEQRQSLILDRLESEGSVRVAALADQLDVAVETIRRDLERLERQGKLTRTHGGAVPRPGGQDVPFAERRSANHQAKVAIARRAVAMIEPGDVVGFDASSTVYELVRILSDMSIVAVTNAMPAILRLATHSQMRLFCAGGTLDVPSRSTVGPFAEHILTQLNIQKLFLSSKGVHLTRGMSELDEEHARIKRHMVDVAEQVYLLADHSKLGKRAAVHVADLDKAHTLITDADADPEFLSEVRAQGIRVEVVG